MDSDSLLFYLEVIKEVIEAGTVPSIDNIEKHIGHRAKRHELVECPQCNNDGGWLGVFGSQQFAKRRRSGFLSAFNQEPLRGFPYPCVGVRQKREQISRTQLRKLWPVSRGASLLELS